MEHYDLARNGLQVFDGAKARRLRCERGRVWLTFSGVDVVLGAGESWLQPRQSGERLVIQALEGTARFSLCVRRSVLSNWAHVLLQIQFR